MIFEIDLSVLENYAGYYEKYIRKIFISHIDKVLNSLDAQKKYIVLNEYAQKHISEQFNSETLIAYYCENLYFDTEEKKILCGSLSDKPYSDCDLSLEDMLKFLEFGVKDMNLVNVPNITLARRKTNESVNEIKNYLETL